MKKEITIRRLSTIEELKQMQVVEEAVWRMSPTPIHQTYTASNHGGIILGAFYKEEIIGFLYSFPGFSMGSSYLCSHMLGILPEYRKYGIGEQLKLKQKEIAKEKGYHMITWTFDPLESVNAYFNIHKLGATGVYYKENHYGSMNDKLNNGLPTDRIQIEWDIPSQSSPKEYRLEDGSVLIEISESGSPLLNEKNKEDDLFFVAIPNDYQNLKQENFQLAEEWRFKARQVMQDLFKKGFIASDVLRITNQNYYVFTKKEK